MAVILKLIANFCALFLAIDIAGHLSAFSLISEQKEPKQSKKNLYNTANFIFFVSLVIMFIGWLVFALMGIRPFDIQIAAGVLLLIFSISALFRAQEDVSVVKDTTLFPALAQLIITPVFSVMLLVLMSLDGFLITALSLIINLAAMLYFLLNSSKVTGLLGPAGVRTVSRIVKIMLCSYAVMLIREAMNGILK